MQYSGPHRLACDPQPDPPANSRAWALGVAGTEWVDTAEYSRKYHVPLQAAVWRAAVGAGHEDPTRRSGGEMRGVQSDGANGYTRDDTRGISAGLSKGAACDVANCATKPLDAPITEKPVRRLRLAPALARRRDTSGWFRAEPLHNSLQARLQSLIFQPTPRPFVRYPTHRLGPPQLLWGRSIATLAIPFRLVCKTQRPPSAAAGSQSAVAVVGSR